MALTTAANVRALSEGGGIDSAEDTLLGVLIGRAGVALARHCGYPPASAGGAPTLESASYTRYSGDGGCWVDSRDSRILHLEPWPVTAISSIYDDTDEEYGASTLVDSGDYSIVGTSGSMVRLTTSSTHGSWSRAERAVKVAFTAGFSSVPSDLEHAAIELVLHWWGLRRRRGHTAMVTPDGMNTSYRDEDIPAHVRQLVAPYRLPSVVL